MLLSSRVTVRLASAYKLSVYIFPISIIAVIRTPQDLAVGVDRVFTITID